jgi:Protein of unknown function (DUF2950)
MNVSNIHALRNRPSGARVAAVVALLHVALTFGACRAATPPADQQRTFASPEDAVRALNEAAKGNKTEDIIAIFGPESRDLVEPDPVQARQNRQVFVAAAKEKWHLEDQEGNRKILVIGNENWPFPVPLIQGPNGWRFDTEAGKEEVISRRIGRNELAAIKVARAYVAAQHIYAREGRDGKPAGRYAQTFRSETGKHNGLYWAAARGQDRSPLGDLVAEAAQEGYKAGNSSQSPTPFHGYYFRILTGQGPAANGGAKNYIANGEMTGGFALVAWPAEYDNTGVMTFVINQEGILREKDLGGETEQAVKAMTLYNPDESWGTVQ